MMTSASPFPGPILGLRRDLDLLNRQGRWRWMLVLGLALAMHALVLLSIRPTLLSGRALAMAAQTTTTPPMTVRMVPAEDATAVRRQSAVSVDPNESLASGVPFLASVAATVAATATPPVSSIRTARHGEPVNRVAAVTTGTTAFAGTPPGDLSSVVAPTALSPAPSPAAATAAPALPPAPAYLSGGKLDPGPRPLHDIEPAYPAEANLREGSVVLRLLVSEAGEVDDVAVVRAFPRGLFEASALAAFGQAKFLPGLMLGLPVKSQITIEVQFTPINRGATVSGRSY